MNAIEVLPDIRIEVRGAVSQQFLLQGVNTFHEACCWVKNLPYGFNSSSENSLILFEEQRGTCTTKHGAIARLAQELELEIYKNLGFYRLNDEIVTGVNAILQPYGLDFIPQIHCFLEYDSFKVDLTEENCNGKNKTIEDYDFIVQVNPDPTKEEKLTHYAECLEKYYEIEPKLQRFSVSEIMEILEECDKQLEYRCSLMGSAA